MTEKEMKLKTGSARIRLETLKMLKWRGYGHLGGAMSIVELLSVLYNEVLKYDPKNPDWPERDYVVLSKGHSGPSLYAALALHGFFDKEWLYTLNEGGTRLPSHPDRLKTPGVDATTGSLGQGTSVAAGLGMALRLEKLENAAEPESSAAAHENESGAKDAQLPDSGQRVYLIVGDGELNEGQCWEAFQFMAHQRLNEVIVIIDYNKRQLDGRLEDIITPFDLKKKMESFGFRVPQADGKEESSILDALTQAKKVKDSAVCVLLDTVKAQGVPCYEDKDDCHAPKFDEKAKQALDEVIEELEKFVEEGGGQNVESCR